MGDNGVDLGENGTEFENNDFGEKDVSVTLMRSDYAGEEGLLEVLKQMVLQIVYSRDGTPFIRRTKQAFMENGPLVKQAATNSTRNLMDWTLRGGPWRAFLVISGVWIPLTTYNPRLYDCRALKLDHYHSDVPSQLLDHSPRV